MKKQTVISLLLAVFFVLEALQGQQPVRDARELAALQASPMEAAYLHLNSSTLMPGETLYYSLYCINIPIYRLSGISQVAYVQLVGADGNVYKTQKVTLRKGRGQGDLFLDTTLPSGPYKLVAFTNWMKNAGAGQFFTADITLVNPYQGDASAFQQGEIPIAVPPAYTDSLARSILASAGLALETDNTVYGLGQPVKLQLRNFRGALGHGDYSLSVSRVEEVPEFPPPATVAFAGGYNRLRAQLPQKVGDTVWIPEQRGALISGTVKTRPGGEPVSGVRVAVSLPGENFQLLAAETNAEGRFYAYLNAPYTGDTGFVELLQAPPGQYAFEMDDLGHWKGGSLGDFRSVRIDSSLAAALTSRSVHNQIENSYYPVKPDTVQAPLPEDSYFYNFPKTYDLDQYTRFPTLRETLVEIIEHVWVRREASGSYTLWVRAPLEVGREVYTQDPPLVTVDGILVADHTPLLDFNANSIRYIRVVQNAIQWGGQNYQGMVAIETRDRDYPQNWQSPAGKRFPYRKAELRKRYFRQPLEGVDPHIPDFRHQLLWLPNVALEGAVLEFPFLTSQVPGRYRINLEGFTTYGKPISLTTYIAVEE